MPSTHDFRVKLSELLESAKNGGLDHVDVTAVHLHTLVGGYPGPHHAMPSCCNAMKSMMRRNDEILHAPPSGYGASLQIRYYLKGGNGRSPAKTAPHRIRPGTHTTRPTGPNSGPGRSDGTSAAAPGPGMEIAGIRFGLVCEIVPVSDENGIVTYAPQEKYAGRDRLPLNRYGRGRFCRFGIPKKWAGCAGVYAISIDDRIVYVGKCENLYQRFTAGYGNISPRNCYEGGQSTNCRINAGILMHAKKRSGVLLYFFETRDRDRIERLLIFRLRPAWNRTSR